MAEKIRSVYDLTSDILLQLALEMSSNHTLRAFKRPLVICDKIRMRTCYLASNHIQTTRFRQPDFNIGTSTFNSDKYADSEHQV